MDQVKEYAGLLAVLISIGSTLWMWITAGSRSNTVELQTVSNTLIKHAERLQALEQDIKHLPTKDTVMELKLALSDLNGTVGRLDESLGGVQRTVLRIDDYLRQDKRA
jgi:Protein of unknown function (DUF2730)